VETWEKVTWASTLGGMVINTAGVTAPHGMEHPASGLKDIFHGTDSDTFRTRNKRRRHRLDGRKLYESICSQYQ